MICVNPQLFHDPTRRVNPQFNAPRESPIGFMRILCAPSLVLGFAFSRTRVDCFFPPDRVTRSLRAVQIRRGRRRRTRSSLHS